MMTRERVLAALNHEEPDVVPIWTIIDSADVLRRFAPAGFDFSRLERDTEEKTSALREVTASALRALEIDVTFLCGEYMIDPFPRERAQVQTRGATDSPFKTVSDLARYTPGIPSYADVAEKYVETFKKAQDAFAPHTMLVSQGGSSLEAAHNSVGLELFSLAVYESPADVGRILDAFSEIERLRARIYADNRLSFAYQISGDIAYKNGTMFSPEFLRKEYFPRLKKELEPVKNAGMKVVYHSDGNLMDVLDDLVDAGIDALNPLEFTAAMDLGAIKKRYGRNLVLVGNLNANVATLGTPSEIVAEVKRCIREGARGGGYFFDTGAGEIMPGFPVENVVRMCEAVKRYGRYPVNV